MSMFPPSIPISPLSVSVEQKSFYPQHFQFQYSKEVQKNEFCLRKSSKVRTATKNRGNGKNRSQRRLEDNSHLGKTKPNTNKKSPHPPNHTPLSIAYFNTTWALIISQWLALHFKPIPLHPSYSQNSLKYRTGNENLNCFYKVICDVCTVSRKSAAKPLL